MQIDTVVYYQITDPRLFTYGVVADGPVGNLNRALYAQLADIPVRDSGFVLLRFPEHGGLALL